MVSNLQTIKFEIRDGIGIVTFNRPEKYNCINATMLAELKALFDDVCLDASLQCLLITGSGKGFCTGQDLNERARVKDDAMDLGKSLKYGYHPVVRQMKNISIPIVCAVNGVAAGAGANLALCCDIVIAARSAYFVQSFSKIGLVPDCGGTWTLPRLVGSSRALGLLLTAEKIEAEKAEQWGMIYRCVDDDLLAQESLALCEQLSALPRAGLGLIKKAVAASVSNTFEQQFDLEVKYQSEAGSTADYAEAVDAFLHKRKPNFSGV